MLILQLQRRLLCFVFRHLTPKRTASGHNVSFQVEQEPQAGGDAVPGRAGGYPTGPPTDPDVPN
jgi:hypothetical protein